MGTLLLIVILALLVVGGVLLVVVLRGQRRRQPGVAAGPRHVDPLADHQGVTDIRAVQVGDMVDYQGSLFFVRGSLRFSEGGYTWAEHFLDDARGQRCWISVEEDPDLEVALWYPLEGFDGPPGDRIEYDGVAYRLDERGQAQYRSEGTTTVAPTGRVEYVDYTAGGGRALSFERYDGGPWEAGLGQQVILSALKVYPAGNRP